jgi:hypothetical protein
MQLADDSAGPREGRIRITVGLVLPALALPSDGYMSSPGGAAIDDQAHARAVMAELRSQPEIRQQLTLERTGDNVIR